MSSISADEQATRQNESISAAQRVTADTVHALTIVDGRGGSMRFEVAGGQAFWLAAGLRRLLDGLVSGEKEVLKVQAGDQHYLLSRRVAWGELGICISELFDPSATVTLNAITAEMLAALIEVVATPRTATTIDAPRGAAADCRPTPARLDRSLLRLYSD